MPIPFLSAVQIAGALRWRGPAARRLVAFALALAGMLAGGAAQATVYTFSGKPVDSCSLSGTVYTCPYPAYLDSDDAVVIGSGYTLKVTNNVSVSWHQGLSMSSGSKLIVTGDLNLTAINPSNLKISGGDIDVGGTFSMGASAQSATANISAGAIQLGSARVTITGNLVSKGLVSISSHSNITGDISGSVVNTNSPVTITGDVTATSKFTLASGSSVTGKISAPVFDMLASGSKVTGDITASTSMTMGSGNTVTGTINTGTFDMQASSSRVTGNVTATKDMTMGSGTAITGNVDTGNLLLKASNALITGDARVNWATLEWAGKVSGTIYCKSGTAKDKCDCVTNNSGNPVNSADGPRCEGAAPKTPHHFLITHDGEGDTCLPEKITVTACANATCTAPHFTGAVSGEITPLGASFTIAANTGSTIVSATRIAEGAVSLGISNASLAPQSATTCYRTNNTNSCGMTFAGGAKLLLSVPDHVAGTDGIKALIQAVKANDEKTACVAAFENTSYNVQYSCNYSKPKTGTQTVTLGGKALACGASGTTAAAQTVATSFGAGGKVELPLKYADVGEVRLNASVDTQKGMTAKGEGSFITGPARFLIEPATGIIRAGADFSVKLTALNVAGVKTPNFDTNDLNNAGASNHAVALNVDCHKNRGNLGTLTSAVSFVDGVAPVTATWSDVGNIDLKASLTAFLGTALGVASTTNTAASGGCSGTVGPFIPAYYKVALTEPRASYYSGEPFPLKVSAMNKAGAVTVNYTWKNATATEPEIKLSEPVALVANDKTGTAFDPLPGSLANGSIAASAFQLGEATVKPTYTFTTSPTAPTQIRLRASNNINNSKTATTEVASTAPASAEQEAMPVIRSGRLRVGSRFGGHKTQLSIPITVEYWTGRSWVLASDHPETTLAMGSFAFTPKNAGMVLTKQTGAVTLTGGAGAMTLSAGDGAPGQVDIAINLGMGVNGNDTACAGNHPATAGAGLPWLRVNKTCPSDPNTAQRDPSGRATFGVYTPENRRIIHVREVFN